MISWDWWQRSPRVMTPFEWCVSVATISFAIWMIPKLRSYFREDSDDADETLEMLTQFRDLHHEGGLSDDEFRSIRCRLSRRVQEASATVPFTPDGNIVQDVPTGTNNEGDRTSESLPEQLSEMENVDRSKGTTDSSTE